MPKCSYCSREYENPRGLTLVLTDGNVLNLCSSKCRKNMKMKRRKVRWISKKKKAKEKKEPEKKKETKETKEEKKEPEKKE